MRVRACVSVCVFVGRDGQGGQNRSKGDHRHRDPTDPSQEKTNKKQKAADGLSAAEPNGNNLREEGLFKIKKIKKEKLPVLIPGSDDAFQFAPEQKSSTSCK